MNDTTLHWMWLQAAIHQGTATVPRLLRRFSTVEDIYRAARSDFLYVGVPDNTLEALCNKDLDGVKALAERALQNGGWILTPDDADYPAPLKQLYSPPLALYGKGVLPDLERMPVIGVVGTRNCTKYGLEVAGGIAAGLAAAGCPVISGGAKGIDRAAHEGAMYGGGITVAVQACGLDVNYPVVNRYMRDDILERGGALISEYPPGTAVLPTVFQVRNRLISGLSWGICVAEAPRRSGALMTARLARDQGKDVFAVPGSILSPFSEGSNRLIRDGAIAVTAPSDILREYQIRCGDMLSEEEADDAYRAYSTYFQRSTPAPSSRAPKPEPEPKAEGSAPAQPLPAGVSDACRRVYDALGETSSSPEQLLDQTGLSLGEIFSVLTELEIYGCVHSHPGQLYSK